MKIRNTKTCYTYTIQFTEEEWETISDGWIPDTYQYFTSYLWSSELESILEDADTNYSLKEAVITLNDNNPQLLENVVQKFLNKSEI